MHSTALTKPETPITPEKLIDEALTKMFWYMTYTERQLARIDKDESGSPQHGASEIFRRRIRAYEAIKAELSRVFAD